MPFIGTPQDKKLSSPTHREVSSLCELWRRKFRQRIISSVVLWRRKPLAIRISSVVDWRRIEGRATFSTGRGGGLAHGLASLRERRIERVGENLSKRERKLWGRDKSFPTWMNSNCSIRVSAAVEQRTRTGGGGVGSGGENLRARGSDPGTGASGSRDDLWERVELK